MKLKILNEKLFWTILISLLVGFILFQLFQDSFKKFDNVISLLNTLAACLTFGITYLLFDKYGIKKNVVEKQFDAVVEIIQELKKIRILFDVEMVDDKGLKLSRQFGQIFIQRNMSFHLKKDLDNDIDKKDFPILLNVQDFYNGTGNLSKSLTNIWLPSEIKEKFSFLNIPQYTIPMNLHQMNTVTFAFSSGILKANPPLEFYIPVHQNLTFSKFVSGLEAGLAACEDWINKHAEHDFKLNI